MLREGHVARLKETLERSTDCLRWSYQRIANWERNQHVTSLQAHHGHAFLRSMSIADKFASEWAHVLSRSHRTAPLHRLATELRVFASVPPNQILTADDNERLLRSFTEAEVLSDVIRLNRHKSAGPDGLNNIFYKIWRHLWFLLLSLSAIKSLRDPSCLLHSKIPLLSL